jgi:glycosyltransferase involved in cell wall biosynthesis
VAAVARHCRDRRVAYVIDAHTGAFRDDTWLARRYRHQFSQLAKNALVTLVHNEGLVPLAFELGIRHLVMEMAVPEPAQVEPESLQHPAVAVVCGYGRDEPLAELLGAARSLPDVTFYLSGNCPGTPPRAKNLVLTGFRTEPDYWRLLKGCDAVVVLTTRESTILSGAYEGLAAGKPLVLSRTATLEQAFARGAVLVENRPDGIAAGIRQALGRAGDLAAQGHVLAAEKRRIWDRQFRAFQRILAEARPRE